MCVTLLGRPYEKYVKGDVSIGDSFKKMRQRGLGSHRTHGAVPQHFMEVLVLLELKANSCLPTLRDSLSVSFSRIQRPTCSILDDGTDIRSHNVCKQLPTSTAQHPTKSKASNRPRRKPTTLYPCYYVSLHLWLSFRLPYRILNAFLF
jgi:hypothetical protein